MQASRLFARATKCPQFVNRSLLTLVCFDVYSFDQWICKQGGRGQIIDCIYSPMSVLILYEISGEPKSAYLNALEMVHVDAKKEVFLVDVLEFMMNRLPSVGYKYAFYAVVRNRLVWLDSPTSLVPVCPDGIIRLVLKPTAHPPVIHVKQYLDFADKSRMQLYSKEDYEHTGSFAFRTFQETKQRAATKAPRVRKQEPVRTSFTNSATPFATTFPSNATSNNSADFFPSSATASYKGALSMEDPFAQPPAKYVDTPELRGQYDEFADFDANFEKNNNSKSYTVDESRPRKSVGRGDSAPYRDEPEDRSSNNSYRDGHDDERRYSASKYNLDHRGKSSSHIGSNTNSGTNNNETGLNSIVGEETAAALTDAVEAAGVAAKSFLTFASSWGKSVIESVANTTQAAAQGASTSILHSGAPGKLYPGAVIQVRLIRIHFSYYCVTLFGYIHRLAGWLLPWCANWQRVALAWYTWSRTAAPRAGGPSSTPSSSCCARAGSRWRRRTQSWTR